ncbi:MAG: hypothetical protein ABIJ96_08130 [Elusimicrobiota bacterium]
MGKRAFRRTNAFALTFSVLLALVWLAAPAAPAADIDRGQDQLLERERRRARARRRKRNAQQEAAKPKSNPPPVKKWMEDRKTVRAFVRAVKGYVSMKVADEGGLRVRDDELDKTWTLKLRRVHKDLIAQLDENRAFVCAEFRTVGDGVKEYLDLDLFATREKGDWFVDQVVVHKVGGKARFTYNDKHERVPLTAPAPPANAKPAAKRRRKPGPRRPR